MSIENKTPTNTQEDVLLNPTNPNKIKHVQESGAIWNKLHKINNILWSFDFSDTKEKTYRDSLKTLDQNQLSIVQKLNKTALQDLLNKPQEEVSQFLIQAQIKELEAKGDLSTEDKKLRYNLKKQLITVEKLETKKNSNLIAAEKSETQDQDRLIDAKLKAQDTQISGLRGALLENAELTKNAKISTLLKMIKETELIAKNRDGLSPNKKQALQGNIQTRIQEIQSFLNTPWNLESIVKTLGWKDTEAYRDFKSQLFAIEWIDFQLSFDRVEMAITPWLAQIKLWTDNLRWVNIDSDILTKTTWDLIIEASKNTRNLSLEWSNYKLPSELDLKYENKVEELNLQSMKELAPYNKELNKLSTLFHFIKTTQENVVRFDETKTHIKQKHPETYNRLGLSSKKSFNELTNTIQAHMKILKDSKKKITKKIIQKLETVISQNKKEAEKKDKATEEMLRFFNDIGLDIINQNTFTQIINIVNLNPQSYGLQHPIDLKNGNLGFDFDFWNKYMSLLEKKAFIGFVNKMLWENVINENIATGIHSLQPEAMSKLRLLNNKTIGFFIGNLNIQEN